MKHGRFWGLKNRGYGMKIRHATPNDLDVLSSIENTCFPPEEAASRDRLRDRLNVFPTHFWLFENDNGEIIGFANGMVVNQQTFSDDCFANANLHDKNGDWQTIFGVLVLPEYRKRGYAGKLLEALANSARQDKRKGCILTCKQHLVNYYEKHGYQNKGLSGSTHGGACWYNMVLTF
jgi:ribosomal protein S18 acetylase RimI-like enzyme